MNKIFLMHFKFIYYKVPLFRMLNKLYDITYILTGQKKKEIEKLYDLRDLKYKCTSFFVLKNKYWIPIGLIPKLLFGKYDILIAIDQHTLEAHLGFLISKLRGKKFIMWSDTWEWPRRPVSILLEPVIRIISKYSDACLVVGSKQKEYFIKKGANPKKIFITPYTTLSYKAKKKIKLDLKGKKVVLYIGRLVPYKGADILVKAFAKIKDKNIVLLMGGEGPFKKDIEELINKSNLKNVYFLGEVNEENKGDFFAMADVFVLPSTFRNYDGEAWGLVLNEAMSSGLPIISTDAVGGAYDLIKNGKNGYMVRHNNVEELYKAIERIIKDDKLRKNMGREAKKTIEENFNYDKMLNGFKEAFNFISLK